MPGALSAGSSRRRADVRWRGRCTRDEFRKTTLSIIKVDIGSIGGDVTPSHRLLTTVRSFVAERSRNLLLDHYIGATGDDIAILISHTHGVSAREVHQLVWDAFVAGTATARAQGLYGAGQDLLKDAFTGNVHGLDPALPRCPGRAHSAGVVRRGAVPGLFAFLHERAGITRYLRLVAAARRRLQQR